MNQRGQVWPVFALLLVALMGISALSVDMGYYRYQQRLQQSATDAAALAGVTEKVYGGTASAQAAAYADAATNGFPTPAATVVVDPSMAPDSYTTGDPQAVRVTITKNYPRFFGAIYGRGTTPVTTTAVAALKAILNSCIYLTGPTGSNFQGANVQGANCAIRANAYNSATGATINVSGMTYTTSAPGGTGTTYTKATPAPGATPLDPCPFISSCNYLTNNPPPCLGSAINGDAPSGATGIVRGTAGTWTCYSSLSLKNGSATLRGMIAVTGSINFDTETITSTNDANGVTLYLSSTGLFSTVHNGHITLEPPTTGNSSGVAIYQVSGNTSVANFSNATTFVSGGLMYFPSTTNVNFNGCTLTTLIFVAPVANFNNCNITLPGTGGGAFQPTQPSLAE